MLGTHIQLWGGVFCVIMNTEIELTKKELNMKICL